VIIGRKGSFGKVNYSDAPCFSIDTTFFVDPRHSKGDMRWLFYALGLLALDSLSHDSAVPGLSREEAHDRRLPLPPLPEQRAIADFLDRETARMDALLAKKERLIELLQEKRSALISEAVTRGLDPHVPLKESGVEWLGKVPAHWEVEPLRFIATSVQTGPFGSQLHASEYVYNGIPVVNPANLRDGAIVPDMDCTIDESTHRRLVRHELEPGDIVFARRGEMGRCALVTVKEQGWLCGTGSLRVRPKGCISYPPYLSMLLSVRGVAEWLSLRSVGSTMENLNTTILSSIPLPKPPLSEQCAIAAHLERETARIDALIAKVRESMERWREYRAALIAAAVTGKIDVRELPSLSPGHYLPDAPDE
jgi:type I restriction enzyme S subunit